MGDYLLVYGTPKDAPDVVKKAQDVKDQGTGIKVYSAIGYRKIHDMVTSVSSLPKGIDFIIYDYEGGPGYSPEFSTDEAASILNFAKAKWLVEEYNNATGGNARLLVTPPYGQLRQAGWDWQSASANMGAIDIQLQAFLKDPQLVVNAKDIVEQIRRQGNDKIVFVQLSIIPTRGTILDNIQAINNLKGIRGIDAVLIFYKNTQGADLEKLFAMLRR
ncbi:MAG TPA: hypothetical protein VJ792_09555 [Candidatus Nitrosotalea sp.]|nr:hypothetical protein [Candidatus Nitrosotalea sp.]